jgi:hypothetical protein
MISGLLSRIPYATKQGIILAEQGISAHEQGILSGLNQNHCRMRFSVHTATPAEENGHHPMQIRFEECSGPTDFSSLGILRNRALRHVRNQSAYALIAGI